MAGVRKRNVIVSVFIFFIISYVIFLLPIFTGMDFLHHLNILFLSFNEFEEIGLVKFNPQYLILFCLMFYLLYHQQLSIINENSSFLSMGIHKMKKRKIFASILIESGVDNLIIFMSSVLSIAIIYIGSTILFNNEFNYDINQIIKVVVYLVKFDFYLFTMIVLLRILNLIKMSNYYTLMSYLGVFVLIGIDFTFKTSLITIAKVWQSELVFAGFMIGINLIILTILYFKIYRGKELYND